MSYRDRDFDRGRGGTMDWGGQDQGGGHRGRFSQRDRFGGWNDEGQNVYGDPGFRGQERYGDQFGGRYGQGGYGQNYGRQATDWQGESSGNQPFGPGGWEQGPMSGRGYRGEEQFGVWRGDDSGPMSPYGDQGYAQRSYGRARGWQPNAEQGWGTQGRRRGGPWDQDQDWERGPSGRGNWGQGYSDQGFYGQGQQDRQRFGGQGYGGQGRPGGGTFYYEEVWLIPGPHSGRGPRGYQRNDQRIEEDICERLTQHGQIDAEDIQVKVKNGEVTLTGTVESRQTKRMAEDALDSISGIKDIHNQLRVQQGQEQGRGRSDQDQVIGQTQMGEGDGQSRSGSSRGQSKNQSRRNETAEVGASNS